MNIDNDVLDYLGSDATVEMMHYEFDGLTVDQIENKLNQMFPGDDNSALAVKISQYTA